MEENNDTMELIVSDIQEQEQITFNYEQLKSILTNKVEVYKNTVYTEETISLAKTDRANLNKLSSAINDEKKRIKNLLLAPYTDFETKCKELMAIVDEASNSIDTQVKAFEQKAKNEKLQEIMKIWIENIGEYSELIDFDSIFNPQWENKTYAISKVETDIKHIIEKTKMDLATLDSTVTDPIINKQVKDYYFKNINNPSILGMAIQESKRIEESNQKLDTLENSQEITKSEENVTNSEQNITRSEVNELRQLDFRVWVTVEQMAKLKAFLKDNNIKFGRVE